MATEVSSVSEEEWDVWRAFFRMRRQLDLALERQLHQDADISAADYEVLLALFEAPEKQLRSRELSGMLGWEKSRLSHQATRMERRGLVERADCDTDGRGTWIAITADGRRAVLGAMREHAMAIRRLFFDALTPEELATLESASNHVLAAIDPRLVIPGPEACEAAAELDELAPPTSERDEDERVAG